MKTVDTNNFHEISLEDARILTEGLMKVHILWLNFKVC